MKKDKTAFGLLVLLIVGLMFISGCAQVQQKLSTSDFSISNFKYESYTEPNFPVHWDSENGNIRAEASFIISTNREGLFYRVYDKIHNKGLALSDEYATSLKVGDNKFNAYNLNLDNLNQQPQIEICVGNKYDFNKNSPDVVCKIETFPAPKIDVSVNPDPITFTISKKDFEPNYKTITVTNTGNVPMYFAVYPPSYVGRYDYPKYYPQYMTRESPSYLELAPGQSDTYSIAPSVGNFGEFNTPVNTYDSTGYIWAISPTSSLKDALFKKSFTLKTTVTE